MKEVEKNENIWQRIIMFQRLFFIHLHSTNAVICCAYCVCLHKKELEWDENSPIFDKKKTMHSGGYIQFIAIHFMLFLKIVFSLILDDRLCLISGHNSFSRTFMKLLPNYSIASHHYCGKKLKKFDYLLIQRGIIINMNIIQSKNYWKLLYIPFNEIE